MRRRDVIGETTRNLRSRTAATTLLMLTSALLGAAVVVASWFDTTAIESMWEEQVRVGAYTFSITASDHSPLEAARCDALKSVEGVRAAGAVLSATSAYSAADPRTRYLLIEATPGYLSIAFPLTRGIDTSSTVAGATVTDDLGLTSGAEFAYRTAATTPVSTIVLDAAITAPARFDAVDGAVVVAAPPAGGTSECWVEAWPGSERAIESVLSSWFPSVTTIAKRLARDAQLARDADHELQFRLSQWAPYQAVLVLGGASILIWWARRGEFALYRVLGMTSGQSLLMLSFEVLATAFIPMFIGACAAITVLSTQMSSMTAGAVNRDLCAFGLCLVLLPLVGQLVIARHTPFDVLKGR